MTFWNLKSDSAEPEDGVLDIDGEIVAEAGWFTPDGACIARDFRKALDQYRNVTVHINSPGGDVMAGAEIYSALKEHRLNGKGSVTVIITALAASAASIVAMAADRILMHPVAYMMIHNPWTFAIGDAKELRKVAKTLDVISEGLIGAYAVRTGKSQDELKKLLEAETWMSAATCVEEGFADEIIGAMGASASALRPVAMSMKAHGVQEIIGRMSEETEMDEQLMRNTELPARSLGLPTEPTEPDAMAANAVPDPGLEAIAAEAAKRREIIRRAEIMASVYC